MIKKHGLFSTASYLLVTVAFDKISLEINAVYNDVALHCNETNHTNFSFFKNFNDISKRDQKIIEDEYGTQYIDRLKQNINSKNIFIIGYVDNMVASTFWIKFIENETKFPFNNYYLFCGDYTQQEYRGQGLQKKSIDFRKHVVDKYLCSLGHTIIESAITNYASINSIEKSDFKRIGTYISFRNKLLYSSIKNISPLKKEIPK
jgi:hypothetical protein